jgi:hypothetical protein
MTALGVLAPAGDDLKVFVILSGAQRLSKDAKASATGLTHR